MAHNGDTWVLCNSLGGIQYQATVTSIVPIIIDGTNDSIKTIQLQAYVGGSPITSVYNTMPIILSKNHGFYSLFEFYGFPYETTATDYFTSNDFPFPVLPFIHQRMDKNKTIRNFKNIDLLWKYQPGNQWITEWDTYQSSYIFQDSILSATMISPDIMQVLHYKHEYFRYKIHPPTSPEYDTSFHVFSTQTDTIYNNKFSRIQGYIPEHKDLIDSNYYVIAGTYKNHWYYAKEYCGNRIWFRDKWKYQTSVSGKGSEDSVFKEDYGQSQLEHSFFQIYSEAWGYFTVYSKVGSCDEGNWFSFKELSVRENEFSNSVLLYPNPSSDFVNIYCPSQVTNAKVVLYSLDGMLMDNYFYDSSSIKLDIANLVQGIYYLSIETNSGKAFKKIIKQ